MLCVCVNGAYSCWTRDAETEATCRFVIQCAVLQMSPIALLERLYSDIPMYKAPIAPKPLQDQLLARKATAQSVHLSPLRGVYEFSAEGSASGVKEGANLLAIFEYEKHSLQDVLKYNRHVLHDDGKAEVSVCCVRCYAPLADYAICRSRRRARSWRYLI